MQENANKWAYRPSEGIIIIIILYYIERLVPQ